MLNFFLLILIYSGIYALMAMGQNIITGYGGMLSLTQAGFFAIGSYVTAILTTQAGWSFWATLPVAFLVSALFGLLIGLPTLRLKGDYLAIATLGFGEIVRNVLNNWDSLTNGPMGIQRIPMPVILGFTINPYKKYAFLVMVIVFVIIAYILFQRLARSRMGRALAAVREDEIAAQSMGINITKYKVYAFILGASVAGIAGSLQATFTLSVTPGTYTFMVSVMVLCMVVLGGMGNFKASILGAFIIQFISYFPQLTGLSSVIPPQFKQILFGLILVVMMIWRPQGILGREATRYRKRAVTPTGGEQ
ncbi:MAG: branched-chain amino acid transport system permease protein [Sphaerochaeta sp.]|jgi:branched-chain amino acid transport system permease protein|uniref:Branched-chain amino acid ABC transporter permease n=1 Tax=Sphaerochaeta halotolerans TaxID=2293840 RepID=A0A372MKT6_9SPIR|nr:branched-chain amino acid ABC transporter permease [Sphaerochaeta halotolerans]MBG0766443.1 branched-chain amino acid ABC transporter permease [Spirochaetaceae bacterium]MDK2859873.1 branched-chain amino acid transport system permease protein [Sphaerochaeta sp.]RFU95936.1 branched-chain amino acid ABC transporter permease [Sphaerochaeta halotolerans]